MSILRRLAFLRPLLVFCVLLSVSAQDFQKPRSYFVPNQKLSNPLAFNLTGPQSGSARDIAMRFLNENSDALGVTATDLANAVVTNQYTSGHNGVTHIYMAQEVDGLRVLNTSLHIHIARDGSVIRAGAAFIHDGGDKVDSRFAISAKVATEAGAKCLGYTGTAAMIQQIQGAVGEDFETQFEAAFAVDVIKTKRAYLPIGPDQLRAVWVMDVPEADDVKRVFVDATVGYVIETQSSLIEDSFLAPDTPAEMPLDQDPGPSLFAGKKGDGPRYEVFPPPYEYPTDGPRVIVSSPANPTASPSGWHSNNGDATESSTKTKGNNVDAYLDRDNNRVGDFNVDGGETLDFSGQLVDLNLNLGPDQNGAPALVNLFFWTNYLHDILFLYGFDEAAGNYQHVNNGTQGAAGDLVVARAQAEANVPRLNNANFLVTPDGTRAIMNMYVWNSTVPRRDGSFSNMIIAHEYAHGLSTRLVGGPADSNCLRNAEQMGEGWSDFIGLVLTAKATDTRTMSRGVGTYVMGEGEDGQGIRPAPYTTDMAVNSATYEDVATAVIPHGVGFIWATMLWDLYWDLVDAHGFNPDLTAGWETGGNILALQLVIDGLKMQGCSPGFIDGRDAILSADRNLTGGANQCLIWEAFARRGLGFAADQGFSGNTRDGFASYELPETCIQGRFRQQDNQLCAGFNKTFDFAVGGLWTGTVSASLISTPDGADFALSETSFTEFPALARITVSNSAGLSPGAQSLTLRLDNGEVQQDYMFDFNVISSAPQPVTLKIPSDQASGLSYLPEFFWEDDDSGTSYTLEVSENDNFSIVDFSGRVDEKFLAVDVPLRVSTIYFWRVISSNSCGQAVSTVRSFTTQPPPQLAASLYSNGTIGNFNLQNKVLYFFPNEDQTDYQFCHVADADDWSSPIEEALVIEAFGDEDTLVVPLSREVTFYGKEYNELFIMSNGFVTFGNGDPGPGLDNENLVRHFNLPRISLFWDDLDPSVDSAEPGQVSYQEFSDRFVVTFSNVSEWTGGFTQPTSNNFQLEIFFDDGMIRLTYLNVDAQDCLVGLSDGRPIPIGSTSTIPARFDLAETCTLVCPYDEVLDRNGDASLDYQDMIFLSRVWHDDPGLEPGSQAANDLNEDGRFDVLDIATWVNQTGPCFIVSGR